MIHVTILKAGHQYKGFICVGHAGYAREGYDIICSAVSALTINTINSLEQFTEDDFEAEQASEKAELLMKSLVLGLQTVEEEYGREFLTMETRELPCETE